MRKITFVSNVSTRVELMLSLNQKWLERNLIKSGRKRRWDMNCLGTVLQINFNTLERLLIIIKILSIESIESLRQPTMKSHGVSLCFYINQSRALTNNNYKLLVLFIEKTRKRFTKMSCKNRLIHVEIDQNMFLDVLWRRKRFFCLLSKL